MLRLPESPRWLMSKNRIEKAKIVLKKMRPQQMIEKEIDAIQRSLSKTKSSWRALLDKQFILPLFVALMIAALNQLTGINVLLQYAPLVIQKAGLQSHVGTMLGTVGLGLINFLS